MRGVTFAKRKTRGVTRRAASETSRGGEIQVPTEALEEYFGVDPNDSLWVTFHHADGERTVIVNQKKKPAEKNNLQPLGTFRFEAGKTGWLEIGNEGTTGHVIIDATQWLAK